MISNQVRTIFDDGFDFSWGKGVQLTSDADISIISSGITTAEALDAAMLLEKEGIGVRLIHIPSIKPLDEDLILKTAMTSRYIITVENHSTIGGLASAVLETISDKTPCRLFRLGINDVFCEGITETELKSRHGINARGIYNKVISLET